MEQLVERARTTTAPIVNRSIGRISQTINRVTSPSREHALGDAVADAYLAATQIDGGQIAFANSGGLRTDLFFPTSPAGEGDGVVTYGEAYAVLPFGLPLVTMTLTGSQLELLLEQQFCGANASLTGQRVLLPSADLHYTYTSAVTLQGVPIDPAASYRVTVDALLAGGGDGFTVLRDGTDRVTGRLGDVDALAEYLGAGFPVSPPTLDRIARVP
jgi:5'-nucleotidase